MSLSFIKAILVTGLFSLLTLGTVIVKTCRRQHLNHLVWRHLVEQNLRWKIRKSDICSHKWYLIHLRFSCFSQPYKSTPSFFFTFSSVQCLLKHIAARLMASKSRLGTVSADSLKPTSISYSSARLPSPYAPIMRPSRVEEAFPFTTQWADIGRKALERNLSCLYGGYPTVKIVNKESSKHSTWRLTWPDMGLLS